MECKNKSDTNNKRGNWDHVKIIHKVPEPHTGKIQNQGTTKNSHIGHCMHSSESTNVRVENIFDLQNNITCGTNYKYRAAVILYIP